MGLTDKLKSGLDTVAKKTNDAVDTGSLKIKINGERNEIEKKKLEIGEKYWSKNRNGGYDEEFGSLFASIETSLKKIEEYENEIAKIRN